MRLHITRLTEGVQKASMCFCAFVYANVTNTSLCVRLSPPCSELRLVSSLIKHLKYDISGPAHFVLTGSYCEKEAKSAVVHRKLKWNSCPAAEPDSNWIVTSDLDSHVSHLWRGNVFGFHVCTKLCADAVHGRPSWDGGRSACETTVAPQPFLVFSTRMLLRSSPGPSALDSAWCLWCLCCCLAR